MSDEWKSLPVVGSVPEAVAPITPVVPKATKAPSWKALPVQDKLSDPYAGQKAIYDQQSARPSDAVIDSVIGDVSGYKDPKSFGTLSQGDATDHIKAPSEAVTSATHLEATKDTPIIPGMSATSPTGVRSALAGVTMNAAPRVLAAMDDRPFEVALHDWHKIYTEAREEQPAMNLLGGLVSPLPFAKAKLAGKVSVGAAAGFISEWLGTDPEASVGDKFDAGVTGAKFGAAIVGGLHVGAPIAGKLARKALPPRVTVASPEFVQNLLDSVHQIKTPVKNASKAVPIIDDPNQTIPTSWRRISESPESITPEYIAELKTMRPMLADIIVNPETQGLTARVHQIDSNGKSGIYVTEIHDADGLLTFKRDMIRYHPDTSIYPDNFANKVILSDSAMSDALNTTPRVTKNMAVPERAPGSRSMETGAETTPRPADEAPRGRQNPDVSVVVQGSDGFLQVRDLKSPGAKVANLQSRSIVAIETAEGTRYGMYGGKFDDPGINEGKPLIVPFDAKEGLPTIARVARVPRAKITELDEEGIRKLVATEQKPTTTPDVNEGAPNPSWRDLPSDTVDTSAPPKLPPQGPEPMPPSEPGVPPPPSAIPSMEIAAKVGDMGPLKRQLIHASQRAELDLADHISDFASLKNLEKVKFNINNALELKMGGPKKLGGAQAVKNFRQDVMLAFEGSISEAKLAELYPEEVFVPKRKILSDAIALRDSNDKWFRDNGYLEALSDDLSPEQLDKYVNREYAAQTLPPGVYAKIAAKDTLKMDLAIAGFKNWKLKKGVEIDDAEARSLIAQALGSKDPSIELFGPNGHAAGSKATGAMKARQDLPDWYRNLLGENRDGFHAVARTIAKQEFLKHNYQIWEAVSANPKWMRPRNKLADVVNGDAWVQIPDDPKLYGKAAGMMAEPFVHDAMVTLPNVPNAADGIMSTVMGVIKTNQMGFPSVRTLMNMLASNIEAGMLAGGVDPTRPLASFKGMYYANKAMYEFKKNPLADNEYAQFIRDMRRIGADAPGHIGLDLNKMQAQQMDDVAARLAGYKGTQDYKSFLSAAVDAHKGWAKPGSIAIDWFDRNQKLASMKIIADDLMSESSVFAGKGKGLDRETAYRQAYKRVAYSNPMFDRLPPLTERMRSSLVGQVNPYSSYGMERNRIWAQLPGRFARSVQGMEDPGLPFRMMKFGAVGAALFGANSYGRAWYGEVTDADVKSTLQNRKGTIQEKFNPVPWIFPVRIDGKVVVMDMTQWSAPLSYMQGDQNLSPLALIALNTVRAPLSDGVFGDALDGMLEKGGISMAMDPMKTKTLGQNTLQKAATVGEYVMKRGGAPRLPQDLYAQAKSAGAVGGQGMRREQQPSMLAGAKALGAPVEGSQTVGSKERSPATFNKIKIEIGQIANIRATMTALALKPANQALGPLHELYDLIAKGEPTEEKRKLFKELGQEIAKRAKELGKTGKLAREAKQSHKEKSP